jgi:cobalt-zinc-cadmium efflux system outer membrane protein
MEDAEKLLLENNIELKVKKTELKKSDAEVAGARLLPNPEARYFLATEGGGSNDRESTYSFIQPVDITGKRNKRIDMAEKRRDSGRLFFDHETLVALSQMKQLYFRLLTLKENRKAMEEIIGMAEEVERKTASRVEAGDASEAELMKLGAEKKRFLRGLENLRTDMRVERKKLAYLLSLPDTDFELEDKLQYPIPSNVRELAEKALDRRTDIKAQAFAVDAAAASLALAKREVLPNVGIEAGYRRWVGGHDGFVFGLVIPLPIFDRNQGKIAAAYAETEKQRLSYELLKRYAAKEIGLLQDKIAYYQVRVSDMAGQIETTKELTMISRTAYEEGAASLIELLDAVRAEKDLIMEYNNTRYEYWATVFELERATNSRLNAAGGKR